MIFITFYHVTIEYLLRLIDVSFLSTNATSFNTLNERVIGIFTNNQCENRLEVTFTTLQKLYWMP